MGECLEQVPVIPYEEQLTRLAQVALLALSSYGLPSAPHDLLQYDNNAVYRVYPSTGMQLVLRVSTASGRSAVEQRAEMQWLEALHRETALVVPKPIPNREGGLVTTIGPHTCVLLHWVHGEPIAQGVSLAVVERLGAFIASLHRHAERFVLPAGLVRPRWDWARLFGPASSAGSEQAMAAVAPAQREIVAAAGARIQQALAVPGTAALGEGLIHADLHRDNILVSAGEIGVIDFDDCGLGYYFFDLATVLDSLHRRVADGPSGYRRQREALLQGYDRVRALPPLLDEYLRLFKAMRDMVNFNFILGSKNLNVQAWGRPRLGAIVDQLQYYLDGSPSLEI